MAGKVYLVGAGPGDPGLITARGLEILRQADVVIYDYLVDRRILQEAKPGAELICCDTLGKNRHSDGFLIHNEKINQLVIKKFKEGKKVIRLKNGDVSIFSRISQELVPLVKNRIGFELVPGIPAAMAAGCLAGIPLTDRRFASSCVFVTGHEDPAKKESALDWDSLSGAGTIVLYMAVENLPNIVRRLLNAGKGPNTPVAVIQDVSLLTQKILTAELKDIVKKARAYDVKPPAIIIIGGVVKLEKQFSWLEKSRKALFTGISQQRFFEKKIFFHLPLIKIVPLDDYQDFDASLKNISDYDWIVFASRYGVQYFFQRLNKIGYDARIFSGAKIAAIGKSTSNRLLDYGIAVDLVPKEESSKGLINEFKRMDLKNKKIFMPRSNLADKGLKSALAGQGAKVTSSAAYKNIMPEYLPDLDFSFFDEIMFTSPSGVRNFVKRYGKLPKKIKVICIGEVTRIEAKKWNLTA